MTQFNSKHWKTQMFSKGSTLNQQEISEENYQRNKINLLAKKKTKATTRRLHAL